MNTTGSPVSGTQSAEDDPSTPAAKRLFVNMVTRKALETAKQMLHNKKQARKHGRKK